jgi:hypothetical protein
VLGRQAFLACILVLAACDSSDDGNPYAEFIVREPLSREIAGRARRGANLVSGAVVRVQPAPTSAEFAAFDQSGVPPVVTDSFGFYRFTKAPGWYDLSFRTGREVVVFRDLIFRYVEPSIGEDGPPPAWTGKLVVTVDPPPAADRELSFFVSGEDVVGVTGDLRAGLSVAMRQYTLPGARGPNGPALHVVEHEAGKPVGFATAYGRTELVVTAEKATPVAVRMGAVLATNEATLDVSAPPGFTVAEVDVSMYFGVRSATKLVGKTAPGGSITVRPVPNAIYAVHARGTNGAQTSDSGLPGFDPGAKRTLVELPQAPSLDGFDGKALTARATGVREHALVSAAGDTFRFVTTSSGVTLSELARLDAVPPPGTYTWRVTHWPALKQTENLAGPDARVANTTATSAPVTVQLP